MPCAAVCSTCGRFRRNYPTASISLATTSTAYVPLRCKTEEAAARYGVPLLAKMPIDPALAKLADQGAIEEFRGDWLDGAVEAILQ